MLAQTLPSLFYLIAALAGLNALRLSLAVMPKTVRFTRPVSAKPVKATHIRVVFASV